MKKVFLLFAIFFVVCLFGCTSSLDNGTSNNLNEEIVNDLNIESEMPDFGSSVAGGGRYDKMVGKFTGKDVPACGFSIGFERIVLLLLESGYQIPGAKKKIAYLIEKGMSAEGLCEVMKEAQKAREEGQQVLISRMNKNKKFQKEQLNKEGYLEFKEFYNNPLL